MHPDDGRVVSNFIVQALKNQPLVVSGDGSQTRSFCYVDDLIEGLIRLMKTPDETTGPVNLGNTEEVPIRELAEMVVRLTGSRSKITYQPLPVDDPLQRCPDLSRARELLDYAPSVPLAEGLERTIQDFKERFL